MKNNKKQKTTNNYKNFIVSEIIARKQTKKYLEQRNELFNNLSRSKLKSILELMRMDIKSIEDALDCKVEYDKWRKLFKNEKK